MPARDHAPIVSLRVPTYLLDARYLTVKEAASHSGTHITTASMENPEGQLSWRLSSHPMTLLFFLGFRICESPPLSSDQLPRRDTYTQAGG